MSRTVDLMRHADADGDVLTPAGVQMALDIGRRLEGRYEVMVSSGAQRATQTLACLLAGMSRGVAGGVVVNSGFRSSVEERWFAVARQAKGKDLEAFRQIDPELVEKESALLGGVLRATLESLPEGGRALVVGHSPTTEAAVLGLTGHIVPPIAKGAGVRVIEEMGRYRVEPIE